jgi:hypothetical protein
MAEFQVSTDNHLSVVPATADLAGAPATLFDGGEAFFSFLNGTVIVLRNLLSLDTKLELDGGGISSISISAEFAEREVLLDVNNGGDNSANELPELLCGAGKHSECEEIDNTGFLRCSCVNDDTNDGTNDGANDSANVGLSNAYDVPNTIDLNSAPSCGCQTLDYLI